MEREKVGVIQAEDTCPIIGQPVLDVLRSKHPEVQPPTAQIMEAYGGKPPAMVPLDITEVTVATVAQLLPGPEGPGGVDSIILQHCLLMFGVASLVLRPVIG